MPAPTIYDLLVGYWKFDALEGGEVPDKSNQRGYGVLTSAALDGAGKIGSGLRTSSSTGKMTVADLLVHRQSSTNRISVNIWINLDKALNTMWGTPKFLDKTGGGTSGYFLGVLAGGGNVVSFRVHNSAGTPYTASYTESATSGWVMITGVYEGSLVRIYRNGVSQNTAAADGSLRFVDAAIDNIGLGFEGVIDELSVWTRMLTSGDVTALYNSGNALALRFPDMYDNNLPVEVGQHILEPYVNIDPDIPADITPLAEEKVTQAIVAGSLTNPVLPLLGAPYSIIDSPRRIFVDPNPVILSVAINGDRTITATANAGPTDAASVTTWWQIEIMPDMIFIVAERQAGRVFEENHDQTDDWSVPFGQNWRNLTLTFWMQANEDAEQVWSSPPVTLTDPLYDNSAFTPTPLPPGPPLGPAAGPTRGVPGPGVYRPRLVDFSKGNRRR